ncbi:hypothetical protein N1F78_11680 [Seonamhaeicola sp. MEBiC1930]|uniref:hypothetical protein n=1 Tax=Seonamhaeicola sp. MEBiC01930 TaxID=2976768 RepID=UPI00324F3A5B
MRFLLIVICFFDFSQLSAQKKFEGELVYHHLMKINGKVNPNSKKYFDTLKIVYKNKSYIKTTNKANYEKEIFIDSLRKIYVIYQDNLDKTKNLSMNEDNLNFGKLYNGENSHFGIIINFKIKDTSFFFKNKHQSFKKIELKRQYGNEVYVYSSSDTLKLQDNRNLLRNIGNQIHPKEVAHIIDNSILYYYKVFTKSIEGSMEFRLINFRNMEIQDKEFNLPNHKDARGFKKENKKRGRFKFYEVIN